MIFVLLDFKLSAAAEKIASKLSCTQNCTDFSIMRRKKNRHHKINVTIVMNILLLIYIETHRVSRHQDTL